MAQQKDAILLKVGIFKVLSVCEKKMLTLWSQHRIICIFNHLIFVLQTLDLILFILYES